MFYYLQIINFNVNIFKTILFFNTLHFPDKKYSFETENEFIVQKSQAWDTLTISKHFIFFPLSPKTLFNWETDPNEKFFQV